MTDRVKATVNALVDSYGEHGALMAAKRTYNAATNVAHRAFYNDVVDYIVAALAAKYD